MRGRRSNISILWADTAFIVRQSWKIESSNWTSRRRVIAVNAVNVSLAGLQLTAWCSNKCDLDPYLTRWSSVMAGLWCFTYQTLSNSEHLNIIKHYQTLNPVQLQFPGALFVTLIPAHAGDQQRRSLLHFDLCEIMTFASFLPVTPEWPVTSERCP